MKALTLIVLVLKRFSLHAVKISCERGVSVFSFSLRVRAVALRLSHRTLLFVSFARVSPYLQDKFHKFTSRNERGSIKNLCNIGKFTLENKDWLVKVSRGGSLRHELSAKVWFKAMLKKKKFYLSIYGNWRISEASSMINGAQWLRS